MRTKAQVGLEVMILLSVFLLLVFGMYGIYLSEVSRVSLLQRQIQERAECLMLSTTLLNVFTLGDTATMSVPLRYNVTVEPTQQRIVSQHSFCTFPFSTVSAAGGATDIAFALIPGRVQVKNQGGTIVLSQP